MLTQETLKKYLIYTPETGIFIWRINIHTRAKAGHTAGTLSYYKYINIKIENKSYPAHRLAFLYMTGNFPESIVAHINCNRSDNTWYNLRQATKSQNAQNSIKSKGNSSGIKGLHIDTKYNGRYYCYVDLYGKRITKSFKLNEKEKAIAWLQQTRTIIHGEFARHA